jgi:hypothetical protein
MATRRRVLNTFLALGEHLRGARRLPHPGPAPHDRANRDGAATLACAERDDLRILNVVGVASVATGAGASRQADPRGRFG